MTMKKQIIYMVCATALLSSCHIYKAYERPDSIDATEFIVIRFPRLIH